MLQQYFVERWLLEEMNSSGKVTQVLVLFYIEQLFYCDGNAARWGMYTGYATCYRLVEMYQCSVSLST